MSALRFACAVFAVTLVATLPASPVAAEAELTSAQALQRLSDADAAKRREAVARLGDVGVMADAKALVARLRDPDEETRSGAEESLWKIWARSGDEKVDALYRQGIRQMNEGLGKESVATFSRIIEMKPDFAEAWNKRATVYFLMGEREKSLGRLRRGDEAQSPPFRRARGLLPDLPADGGLRARAAVRAPGAGGEPEHGRGEERRRGGRALAAQARPDGLTPDRRRSA